MYVPLDTPVLIRNRETGDIYVEKIEKLAKYCTWEKEGGAEVARLTDIDAWGNKGWTKIRTLCRQRVKGISLFEVIHPRGSVYVSDAVTLNTCPKMPDFPELASDYVETKNECVATFRDLFQAQEEYARLKALNYKVAFTVEENKYILYKNKTPDHTVEEAIITREKPYDGYIYTFELEEGDVYQAGFGELMVCGVERDVQVAG